MQLKTFIRQPFKQNKLYHILTYQLPEISPGYFPLRTRIIPKKLNYFHRYIQFISKYDLISNSINSSVSEQYIISSL